MATETDAARDRVLAARAGLGEELETLEASFRAAIDVPAKIRRSPVKAAAAVGGIGFLVLGGPRRLFRAGKRAVTGAPPPLPDALLPDEIERSLRSLGSDGDKIRGTLERDFAEYAKKASNQRQQLRSLLLLSVARPLLTRGARAAGDWLFRTDDEGFQARLQQIRDRVARQDDGGPGAAETAGAAETVSTPPAATPITAPTDEEAGAAGA